MKAVKLFITVLFIASIFLAQEKLPFTFKYISKTADSVFVAGSFNNWSDYVNPLKKKDSLWSATIYLNPGYYYYKFVVDSNWIPDPANDWKINDGGNSYNSIIKVGEPVRPKRKASTIPFPKEFVPQPILENDSSLVDLYYAAWQMAWNKIARGTDRNSFSDFYMDEGFNDLIYQWDTNFMAAFGMYAANLFPVMSSLDNFYKKQRSDGYIQRVYWETNGEPVAEPTKDAPMVNPPLFPWIEWRYYKLTGDDSRLKIVLPHLVRYYNWINTHLRDSLGRGLYYTTPLGSGMDNIPRSGVGKGGWIDFSSQMALAAKDIMNIAAVVGNKNIVKQFKAEYKRTNELINKYCWNNDKQFYYDLREDGSLSSTMHIGAFWALLSKTADDNRAEALLKHLTNPAEFWRPHLVPTLSASDPNYDPKGHYWLGGVWAPTNYMVVRGLENYGKYDLADEIAENDLSNILEVYNDFTPEENKIAFDQRYGDDYKTIWESYSPEYQTPATRWDNTFYARQDFVGWSGLAPIAMLIENIIGIQMDVPANKIIWRIHRNDKHGVRNLNYKDGKVSLIAEKEAGKLSFNITTDYKFDLLIIYKGITMKKEINAGSTLFVIE